ncbi:L-threonylcarbamoyladenylate synthase [Sinanaerobacter chloroacetimidivorans]|jgi:L-threonylcarbamoyladenylate synthase|uniref:Threonylcarbamoyl-AMP synthase n=1 Tax=Sinanaerobacter chloroacetimidivorans TaxID=2818044 RepID=A0A8J7W2B7_9FIRM|nr:L-threonylcarbamoyladenylate synthase [Sinanaerobacter chloroacetimidivorans]MBR0599594.1 threonylcarbamoyl-AMP synthase [Sinanaerobacter chloroacetimidivorans]
METKIFDVSDLNKKTLELSVVYDDEEANAKVDAALEKVDEAAEILKNGGLVAFPTETVYGLGANALDPKAVAKIYEAKGRPSDNPLIVHISRASDIGELTPMLTPKIIKLIDHFWPGPLTMVLTKKDNVPDITTGGLDTVAIRMPDDPAALELIKKAGCPVAAPSANISGRPSPTKGEHVVEDLNGKIDAILVGGDCRVGIESTVLDMTGEVPTILRPGILTAEDIQAAIGGKVEMDPALYINRPRDVSEEDSEGPAPKAPGMKYTHYAPKADMTIIEGQRDRVKKEIERLKGLNENLGLKVGVILFEEKAFIEAAHDFFARLRDLDEEGVDLILAGALSEQDGVGFAVMNRMLKSAGYRIAKV